MVEHHQKTFVVEGYGVMEMEVFNEDALNTTVVHSDITTAWNSRKSVHRL